jgi:hypothetical protein
MNVYSCRVPEIFISVGISVLVLWLRTPPPLNFSFNLSTIINISMAVVRNDEVEAAVALNGCFKSL